MLKKAYRTRFIAVFGLIYIVVGVLPLASLPPPPPFGSSSATMVGYYTMHGTAFRVVTFLGVLGIGFFLCFMRALSLLLALSSTLLTRTLSGLLFGAACIWSTIFLIFSGLIQSLPILAADPGSHVLLRVFGDLTDIGFTSNFVPAALLLVSASLLILNNTSWPRWLTVVGLFIAVLQVVASLSFLVTSGPFAPADLVYNLAFSAFVFWILLVCLYLLFAKRLSY